MERIEGFNIPFDLNTLSHKADLIEQDGPLLSLYHNNKGDYYLLYWLDCDTTANRWMLLRVDNKTLYDYINGSITLRQVIENPSDNFVWIIDIDSNGRQIGTTALNASSIPLDYLPEKDSFFEFDNKQKLISTVATDKYEVDIPQSDRTLFSVLMSKMGWRLSPKSLHKLIDKVAL